MYLITSLTKYTFFSFLQLGFDGHVRTILPSANGISNIPGGKPYVTSIKILFFKH